MKFTFKIFFLLLFFASFLQSSQQDYYSIRLVSSDTRNDSRTLESLRSIKKSADKLSDRLKNRAYITKEKNSFVLYAVKAKSKSEALSWLKSYKKYFKNATIRMQTAYKVEMVRDYTGTITIRKTTPKPKPKPVVQKPKKIYYTIQLASAALNDYGLKRLKQRVAKLDKELKNKVYITDSGSNYFLQALKVTNRNALKGFLFDYQKYFDDAYILKQNYNAIEITKDYSSNAFKKIIKETKYSKKIKKAYKEIDVKSTKKYKKADKGFTPTTNAKFTPDLIDANTFYIVKRTKKNNAMIIEVTFNNFAPSTYKIHIDSKTKKKPKAGLIKKYISEDNKLYLYFDRSTMDNTYHVLNEIKEDYFLVDIWSRGQKDPDGVRFYFDFQKAQEYKNSFGTPARGFSKY